MCTLLHFQAKVITLQGKRSLLHYRLKVITLSGSKFITLSVDVITLSGGYYIISRLHYRAVITLPGDYYIIGCNTRCLQNSCAGKLVATSDVVPFSRETQELISAIVLYVRDRDVEHLRCENVYCDIIVTYTWCNNKTSITWGDRTI